MGKKEKKNAKPNNNSTSQTYLIELKKKMKTVEDTHNAIRKRLNESKETPDPEVLKEYKTLQKQLASVRGDYFDELERLSILQKRNAPKEE